MKGADKTVLMVLPVVALLAAFWFLVMAPKREEAAKLEDDVASLQAAVEEQEMLAVTAEAARETFAVDYRRLVVLGKAVPEDADTSSLLVQLSALAAQTDVAFNSLKLVEGAGGAAPVTPPPAPATPATVAEESEAEVANVEAATAPAPATEQSAANLPLGATVGPAGLPVMPYNLTFGGDFFAIANFIGKLNSQVGLHSDGSPDVVGRLLTVDAFSLQVSGDSLSLTGLAPTSPTLDAEFAVTSYITPPGQGTTAGATPAGPAPVGSAPTDTTTTSAPPVASVGGTP